MPKLMLLALGAFAVLTTGILLFVKTESFFLLGCSCALIAILVNEAQFGSRSWVERAILFAFVAGIVTIFGPLGARG